MPNAGRQPGSRQREAALAHVAQHFGATLKFGRASQPELVVRGKRIPVAVVAVCSRAARGAGSGPPRLRFDRVVRELMGRLRTALRDRVPSGRTVVLTVSAPIRLASKTAVALEASIRDVLRTPAAAQPFAQTLYGNQTRIRVLRGGTAWTSKLLGFVHHRDSDPTRLFDLTRALLAGIESVARERPRPSVDRWLVVATADEFAWLDTYRSLCAQLFGEVAFQRVVLVASDGRISIFP